VTPGDPHAALDPLDLTIVIPCLNEEERIEATLETVRAAMAELVCTYEVLVIDDGCTDGTASVVRKYAEVHPGISIRLYTNGRNLGLTRSYVDGAFRGRGKYYRLVCGDNVEPKETLVAVFGQLGKAEIIIPYHPTVPGKSALRRSLSRSYTAVVNRLSGHKIKYYNGLAVHLRYNVMRWGPYSFGFGFQAELITRLLDEGISYVEVPVMAVHQEKAGRNSALNWRNFLSVSHTLFEISIRRMRKRAFKSNSVAGSRATLDAAEKTLPALMKADTPPTNQGRLI
jgi:glycosyltransferase involved in cell wall biosynthesis